MSFQQGLSGLNAAAKDLDVVGNNVANSSTVGFKSGAAHFADIYANSLASSAVSIGIGVGVAAVDQSFSQGSITTTNNPLDLAISGQGFFRTSNNGAITFGRNGQFQLDKNGYIVNDTGARLTGYLPGANGVLSTSAPTDLQIISGNIAPQTTTAVNALLNFDSRAAALAPAAFDMNDPTTYTRSTSVSTYDSLGNSHALALYFVKAAANTWDVFAANDGAQIVGAAVAGTTAVGKVTFLSNGSIDTTPANTTFPSAVAAPVATGAATPLSVTLDFAGTTQFGSNFAVNQLSQDGFASGQLSGYNVSADGVIAGRYSNGQAKTLGQVALADFTDPQALQPLSNNVWAETSASGPPLVSTPNSGSLGLLQSGAVEDSNVDLTAELVNMITAQRFYQANAQTIKTQDAVMQTLVNLR
jgi:flagellar hook protein FlgE